MLPKLILAIMATILILGAEYAIGQDSGRSDALKNRAETADRTLVLLHTCFPNAVYMADASPICPEFKEFLTTEANKESE